MMWKHGITKGNSGCGNGPWACTPRLLGMIFHTIVFII
jgi:hypothetical protein